jgi:iron(III) transport system permease protein
VTIRPRQGDLGSWLVGCAVVASALIFLVYPLINALLMAFVANGKPITFANLSLLNFERFLVPGSYQRALINSIVSCSLATLLAALLAVPMAFAVARVEIAFRSLVLALSIIPLIAPPFIGAYAWIMLLGNNGIVTQLSHQYLGVTLPAIYGLFGVTVALALSYLPYLFLIVQGALAASDPSIEEAAKMAGASWIRIARTITLPMATPAIAAGMLVVFIKSMGEFGIPSILGGEFQVLPTLIYYQINGFFNLNAAAAIAVVNVLLTLVALLLLQFVNRRAVATVTGSAQGAVRDRRIGIRILANSYLWFVLFLALLPQAVVALYSFSLRWGDTLLPSVYGLDNYVNVAPEAFRTMFNSTVLAAAATILCLAFGAVTAYWASRGPSAAKWTIDLAIMIPFVLPGIVVGVAYLTAFNEGPLVLTGTATILVLAYFTRRVAFVFRSATTSLTQIDPKIEEASIICGASWIMTMRRVMLPLIAPSLIAAAILVFATLIGEISATVLLYSAAWKPISMAIYEFVSGNELAKASALGTICNLATLVLVLVASRLAGRNISDMFR